MAEGWSGANKAKIMMLKKDCFCSVCGATGDLRIFHNIKVGGYRNHSVVCKKHAEELSDDWYGCGCGG